MDSNIKLRNVAGDYAIFGEFQNFLDKLLLPICEQMKADFIDDVSRVEFDKILYIYRNFSGIFNKNYVYVDVVKLYNSVREQFALEDRCYYENFRQSDFVQSVCKKFENKIEIRKFDKLLSGYVFLPQDVRESLKDKTFFDFGAFDGRGAIMYSEFAKKVYAFEPMEQFSLVCANISECGLNERVIGVNAGVGSVSGTLDFVFRSGSSHLIRSDEVSFYVDGGHKVVSVPVYTIDDFVQKEEIGNVGLLKFDVEGAEYGAIQGGLETIKKYRPVLLISVYHTFRDFFEIKDVIKGLNLGYKFMFRHLVSDDPYDVDANHQLNASECVLICYCDAQAQS